MYSSVAVFCLFYTVHGVFCERPYELVILVLGTIIDGVYLTLNLALKNQGSTSLTTVAQVRYVVFVNSKVRLRNPLIRNFQ